MQNWARSLLAVVESNLGVSGRPRSMTTPVVPDRDAMFGRSMAGVTGAELALVEGRLDDVVKHAARHADRTTGEPTPNQVRALDLIARAQLERGDLATAAATATRGLAIAESMRFGSAIWRLRMVQATALGEPTDVAAAEFWALADRVSEPDLRWWFERQPLAPR